MLLQRPFQSIGPTVDGDILVVLAGADSEFTVAQVHTLVGAYSHTGVRKALTRLARYGLVRARRAGPADTNPWMYSLNREHLLSGAVTEIANARGRLLERLRAAIGAWEMPAVYAVMFGSAARGDMQADSDIDILVVRPSHVAIDELGWISQTEALARNTTAWTGNDTRLLEYDETEWRAALAARDPVLEDVRREGLELCGLRMALR